MNILLTGARGFLAKALIPRLLEKGNIVYGLYHNPPGQHIPHRLLVLVGDITKEGLGLEKCPSGIDAIYHLAARLDLTDNKKVWETNVDGTRNVLSFMKSHNIPRLLFMSTAYNQHRNRYEMSKEQAEVDVLSARATQGLRVSVIKPSIIIGSRENPGTDQAINHVALTIAKVYSRVQAARKKVQDTLALPPLELGFRVKGNPQATLNVIPVEVVADEIARLEGKGTFYITNPHPPLLRDVASEIGDALGLNIQIVKKFRSSPPEKLLEKLLKPFLAYMQGEPRFPTIVPRDFEIPQGHVRDMVAAFLN
ncbi:2-alkyl-3-oxoalkanoate reductase [subsurface metagenome]